MTCVMTDTIETPDVVDLWMAEAKLYGQKDPYPGKRRHLRFQWRVPVAIEVASVDGLQLRASATTRDISQGGIGLECRQPIEPDSRIHIRLEGEIECVEGYVVHCTQSFGKYLIGVVFAACLAA